MDSPSHRKNSPWDSITNSRKLIASDSFYICMYSQLSSTAGKKRVVYPANHSSIARNFLALCPALFCKSIHQFILPFTPSYVCHFFRPCQCRSFADYSVISFILFVVCHFVVRLFATSSLHHFVSFRHFVISSLRHFLTLSLRYFVTSTVR